MNTRFGKIWNTEEDLFLQQHYPKHGKKYCAEKLGRSIRSIESRRSLLGLIMIPEFKNILLLKYTKDMLEEAVKNSECYSDTIRYLGLIPQSGNFSNIKNRISFFKVDISHFLSPGKLTSRRHDQNRIGYIEKKPLEFYLVKGKIIDRSNIKERLYNEGIKKRECELCGQGEEWKGKKMSLILDHIDGVHDNNELGNLRIVCPNCNATLPTHCSKNRKIRAIVKNKKVKSIPSSNQLLNDFSELSTFVKVSKKYNVSRSTIKRWCVEYDIINKVRVEKIKNSKINIERKSKIVSKNELIDSFKELKSFVRVGKKFEVSDNAIRKWCKKYNILEDIKCELA